MGDGDAVQSFHTLKQVVCVSSTDALAAAPMQPIQMNETSIVCSSAWGPDADRRAKPLQSVAFLGQHRVTFGINCNRS